MAFPVLSSPPLIESYEHTAASDPVIRSPQEAGYIQTRPRFTRVPKKWHISYPGTMTETDRTLMEAWEASVQYGAGSDSWTHPKTGTVYTVRLGAPIKYKFGISDEYWSFEFDLEEV